MQSEHINELAAALNKAQAEFSAVPKDSINPFFKSTYAALPDVVRTATPVLTKHGLSVSQFIDHTDDGHDLLRTYLLHASGQYIAHSMRLYLVKDDPQGQGSAVTYARRYSYMSVLGLVADVDDDGNAASKQQVQKNLSEMKQAVRSGQPAPQAAPAPAPATGDKVKVSPAILGYLRYAEALNQNSENPNGTLTDITDKAGKYPLTPKQLGFATKLADDVLKAHRKNPEAELKRITHELTQVQQVADAFGINEEPF